MNRIACIALILGISYCSYNFASAESRIKKLCKEITPGMPYEKLTKFGKKHGLSQPRNTDGITYMVETKTYGRWGCQIEMGKGMVQSVEYNFAD